MTRGEHMRKAREDAGLTLRQLDALSGITYSMISRYERDVYPARISLANVEILADTLGLTIDEYIGHERVEKR